VTINYRLGALGFCDLGSQLGDDFATCGINGTLDQVAALTWVHRNIAGFGGDPDRITIGGESAGAFSVCNMLAMPSTDGLFHRAIAQSGAAHHTFDPEEGSGIATEFLGRLGNPSADELLAMDVGALLEAQEQVTADRSHLPGRNQEPFYPVWGHEALPRAPRELIADGAGADIAMLTGTNEDELALWGVTGTTAAEVDDMVGAITEDASGMLATYRRRLDVADPGWLACAIGTDRVFRIPAVRLADARHANGADTWMYRFSWDSRAFDGQFGAAHALEIPFAFNTIDQPGVDIFLGPGDVPTALAETIHDAWIAFIRDGDPSTDALGPWPTYDPERRRVMDLDDECGLMDDPEADERRLWKDLVR
jgi:para-nitrobenzyl esterase